MGSCVWLGPRGAAAVRVTAAGLGVKRQRLCWIARVAVINLISDDGSRERTAGGCSSEREVAGDGGRSGSYGRVGGCAKL